MTRVVHAHDALGVGKLKHHVGHQIAFREQARTRRVIHIRADLARNPAGERLNAVGFVAQRAELLLEQHGFETRQVIFQTFFAVGVEEELRIRQTRTHHFFVTGDNLARIFGLDIRHKDKVRQQLAVGTVHREILLVAFHGIDQRFRRHRQEFLFEFRGQYHRPFHQRGDFFKQAVAQIGIAADFRRCGFGVLLNFSFTRVVVGDDFAALQQDLRVLIGVVDSEFRLAHKAMTTDHAVGLNTKNSRRQHFIVQQQRHGVNRAHELHVGRAPAHQFRNRQFRQRGAHHVRQQRLRAFAFHMGAIHQPLAFVGDQTLRLIDSNAAAARPAFRRFARVALCVKRRRDRRATFFDFAIRLRRRQIRHFQRQTTRRRKPAHDAVGQARRVQFSSKVRSEGFRQAAQGFWWQLFSANLHQKSFLRHGSLLFISVAHREAQRLAGGVVGFGHGFGQRADTQNVALALGHRDSLARVQQVEAVGGFQNTFISRQRQRVFQRQQLLSFFFVLLKAGEQEIHVGVFEVIGGLLHFVLMEHIAVSGFAKRAIAPDQVINAVHALNVHGETLKAVSDFTGHRFALQAADLLEVSELRHFHAVQPHFPAEAPGAERRVFPVVFDEANIMNGRVHTQLFKRPQVQLLNIVRRRLDDHLELVVVL
ncbi:hypothetical protein ESA_04170 [Cronobacter sakazakii ATCC BAA-894]|uniref:Uncharacterized protein n=1 Tax=Cronobacter sakazakii (strain ATCC BAA-894) TaxID=290339 RepID=A7MKS2_CROS8|nr:hypothetical protein ESA_04170 [Cronobacter sakazakii ATCC BAA-894]